MVAVEDLLQILDDIKSEAVSALDTVHDEKSIQDWKVKFLGRNAPIMNIFSSFSELTKEQRPIIGQNANKTKQSLEAFLSEKEEKIKNEILESSLEKDKIDVTLPGRVPTRGRLHPATQNLTRVLGIFSDMGFQIFKSREVETDDYNFGLLNMPEHHPARDMWDTFYTTTPGVILRTHTSPGQIHAMRKYAPEPIRVALPGMCFRYEQITARSEIQFNQVELLAVGKGITFRDLKGTLQDFVRRLFNADVRTRFRPSYFPFTEPSAEMDVECFVCGGKGCSVCKGSGWLEILGCGMTHPVVLKNGGYDPEEYTGFAAGLGTERIMMLLSQIEDIRYFWGNDIRFLEQF